MTSLERLLDRAPGRTEVENRIVARFGEVFDRDTVEAGDGTRAGAGPRAH